MGRKKRHIILGRWFFYIANVIVIILLLKYITDGNVNANIQLKSYIGTGVYGIISTILIKIIFLIRVRNMYLNCDIDAVDEMTGIEFEQFLYFKFRKQGYKVNTTPVSSDYGADLVVRKRRETIVIQAKRYQRDVGIAAVQEVIGSIAYYNASKGMVITNSFFTPNAINLAIANDVILWNRKELIHYLLKNNKIYDISTYNECSTVVEGVCPQCGNKLIQRNGKYGDFLGCSSYPDCGYTESVNQ
ncbi:hypothetical protein acsn021_30540 [Anaerocolumna cellulosilytica]|uniref:Uncharacterized protein n=1 Tax=Anaerocolumna cellulosilytica TaxID=433286 RepID=A0A6S6R8H2_9FIRM|nr:restriction endonuclease [Anaerocolumna cellulosilytica]MBB5197466.1 restriction system protein [Anaerocolumna cellulosilytica]BCJ95485.1 hypothetical protein acsn021_30540 [Anaerocolumna cellulosilytica]